jgi:hypothetical protein
VCVPDPDVYKVTEGALTVMLNDRSAFKDPSVALISKLEVVSEPTALGVPDITPVELFKLIPVGSEPDNTEYVIV